uniref:Uncharacterized protein n=1 Tax=Globisporangium ultimum (strain ATCC 200006 / CBS 805.95 / DAOM BR144) TaxID=431595 RepID=K3WUC1_GLOUD
MTSGCESGSAQKAEKQAHARFLNALQSELGMPALCSCARNMASSPFYERPCANNCALYKHPKKREQLLTSVCKQQQGTSVRKSVSSPAY